MHMLRENKTTGITLIALVITIIVLLILAGITINLVVSDGGIIAKAKDAKDKQAIGEILDRLTIAEVNTAVNYFKVDMEKYKQQLKLEKFVEEDESNYIYNEKDDSYELITDKGYVFNVSEPIVGDIVINYEGKKGELLPKITKIEATEKNSNSFKIQIEVSRLDEGTLTYAYKKESETDYKILKSDTKDFTAEFNNLEQNKVYDVKVTAKNKIGTSDLQAKILTGQLEGVIRQKSLVWKNATATLEIETDNTIATLQYQKNSISGTWKNYDSPITGLVYGDVIYARLWDGVNGTDSFSIDMIDTIAPTIQETSSSVTTNTVNLAVNAIDDESGLPQSPTYTFYRKIAAQDDSTYIKDQEGTSNSYSKTGLAQGTNYTIKVEVKDKAGNTGTLEKNLITGNIGSGSEGLVNGNIIASTPTWSGGTASITLSTATGLTIQWQKNSIAGNWTNTTSVSGLNHNDTVYVRLTDGTNYGDYASATVLDNTIPQNATISLSSTDASKGQAVTATITHNDNESGANIASCKWVYNTTAGAIGTNDASYTGGTFSTNPQAISLVASVDGSYYLHVLTIDKAGNRRESISNKITIAQPISGVKNGEYIAYTGGGYSSWVVLWPANSSIGNGSSIQIISAGSAKNVTLGVPDANVTQAYNAYNNMIQNLNQQATSYINSTYATDARCVGSVPMNKNSEAGMPLSAAYWGYTLPYTDGLKNEDKNYEKDYNQMNALGILNISSSYFLASRGISQQNEMATLIGPRIINGSTLSGNYLVGITNTSYMPYGIDLTYGFRPVVTLKPTVKITGGSGTQADPWRITI